MGLEETMIVGKNVTISPRAVIYGGENLVIGDNVRIDDFCVLSCGGGLTIGNYIHIACYTALYAGHGMEIGDFTGISAHCAFYTASDDYSGETMNNPMIPEKYKRVTVGKLTIGRHCLIGHNVTIMPGLSIGDGVSIGAKSFVNRDCNPWTIYAGIPAKNIMGRRQGCLKLEQEFLQEVNQ